MKKYLLLIGLVAFLTTGCSDISNLLHSLDEQYGDTIPTIEYRGDYIFDKKITELISGSRRISVYASYPNDIDEYIFIYPTMAFIEKSIVDNWKPYLKKDNEVIIALKINKDGSKEYKFLGNTGPYDAANSARTAILAPKLIGDNIIQKKDYVELIYKFTVSGR